MHSLLFKATLAAAFVKSALAGFDPNSRTNVAVYWGQNSYGQGSGGLEQKNLATYCANTNIDIIPVAFLYVFNGIGGAPVVNFANAGDKCTIFPGTNLLNCPEIGNDIKTCQRQYGKTILLSIGGATYSEGGFSSTEAANQGARMIWESFGPVVPGSPYRRPFGDAVVDGFDLDFEARVTNMVPFANTLRGYMDSDRSKRYILTAAPQCPYPDYANNEMLSGAVAFDIVWVQFYNNYCGLQSFVPGAADQWNFNFNTWDNWAKTVSKNRNVRVMLGVPAGRTAAGSGYLSPSAMKPIIDYCKRFSSFGGVMMWDASQAYANPGFLEGTKANLAGAVAAAKKVLRSFVA
jgi:chitinase